jgi:hypothetical protein
MVRVHNGWLIDGGPKSRANNCVASLPGSHHARAGRGSSACHARRFCRGRCGWVWFVQVRALRQAEMVALSLAETDAVVTISEPFPAR